MRFSVLRSMSSVHFASDAAESKISKRTYLEILGRPVYPNLHSWDCGTIRMPEAVSLCRSRVRVTGITEMSEPRHIKIRRTPPL
jgi:hypothetical protein